YPARGRAAGRSVGPRRRPGAQRAGRCHRHRRALVGQDGHPGARAAEGAAMNPVNDNMSRDDAARQLTAMRRDIERQIDWWRTKGLRRMNRGRMKVSEYAMTLAALEQQSAALKIAVAALDREMVRS